MDHFGKSNIPTVNDCSTFLFGFDGRLTHRAGHRLSSLLYRDPVEDCVSLQCCFLILLFPQVDGHGSAADIRGDG